MDFNKYLPPFLIIKNVLTIDSHISSRYILANRDELNTKFFQRKIQSWHPLVLKDGNNFYYLKGMDKQNYILAKFCLSVDTFGLDYNSKILENYFEHNSFEI